MMFAINAVFSQTTTKKLSYQAVVRNADNELVVNQNLSVEITILNANNAPQYKETHATAPTNQNGLLWLWVGEGTPTLGTIDNVVWKDATIKSVFTLPDGNTVEQNTPVTAMPYAYFADAVDTIFLQDYLTTHDYGNDDYVTHQELNDTAQNIRDDFPTLPENIAITTADNNFTGANTVPSGYNVSGTNATNSTNCNNVVVNACDLFAVFDSLNRRMQELENALSSTQQELEELKNSTPPVYNNLVLSDITTSSIKATADFSSTGAAITNYEFCIKKSDVANATTHCFTSTSNIFTFSGLDPYTSYDVTAKATNMAGTTSSSAKSARTLANEPSGVFSAETVHPLGIKVTVNDLDFGGAPSGNVKIYYKKKGNDACSNDVADYGNPITVSVNLTAEDDSTFVQTIGDLDPSSQYCVLVELSNVDNATSYGPTVVTSGSALTLTISSNANSGILDVCGKSSVTAIYTAVPSEGGSDDYTYQWEIVGTSVSENTSTTNQVEFAHVAGNYTVSCTATSLSTTPVVQITNTYSLTVTNTGHVPSFSLCSDSISVNLSNILYADTIKWGDNNEEIVSTNTAFHNYSTSNVYTITAKNSSGCVASKEFPLGISTLHPCTSSAKFASEHGPGDTISFLQDFDGNQYAVAQIGNMCWMKSNLRTTHYNDGTAIANGTGTNANNSMSDHIAYYYQPNASSNFDGSYDFTRYNVNTYGLYYNWSAMMRGAEGSNAMPSGVQGVCPEGWHVPSVREWDTLIAFVQTLPNTTIGYLHVMAGGCEWENGTDGRPGYYQSPVRNSSEFSAIPAGEATGIFRFNKSTSASQEAFFWTSTASTSLNGSPRAYDYEMYSTQRKMVKYESYSSFGYSVRCVRDYESVPPAPAPTVTTTAATNVSINAATLNGTITIPGGATVTAKGFKWKTTAASDFTTEYISGDALTFNLTGLTSSTSYTYLAFAVYDNGTVLGEEVSFTTASASTTFTCGTDKIIDANGHEYNTVLIGTGNNAQCWMAENLRSRQYSPNLSGTKPDLEEMLPSGNYINGHYYYAYPNGNPANEETYGLLYSGNTAMAGSLNEGTQGICPDGWHLPSEAEFNILKNSGSLSSFNILFAGLSDKNNPMEFDTEAGFWTSTFMPDNNYPNTYLYIFITNSVSSLGRTNSHILDNCYSVRCIRNVGGNGTALSDPTVTTNTASNITSSSVTFEGEITNLDNIAITSRGFEYKASGSDTYTQVEVSGSDNPFTTTISSGLVGGTTYTYHAYITFGSNDSVLGQEVEFTLPVPDFTCGTSTVDDADGNSYQTVSIGSQCWMAENLRSTKYSDGTDVTAIQYANKYNPDDDANNVATYGYLYNWKAAMRGSTTEGAQGICPTGWHVPTEADFFTMLGSGGDYSSFNVKAGYFSGQYLEFGSEAVFWTSTKTGSFEAIYCQRVYSSPEIPGHEPEDALPVRCVLNGAESITPPSVTTNNITNIDVTSATLNGSVEAIGNTNITQGFEWKATTSSTYNQVPVSSTTMTYDLSGLTANTNYNYRAFVTSVAGTKYGATNSFMTLIMPSVTTGDADPVEEATATLSATIMNPDEVEITAKGFEYKRTSDNTYTSVSGSGTGNSFTADLTGLDAGTEYTYHAFITTASGTASGNEESFTTTSAAPATFTCGISKVSDADGNTYNTVSIGSQCWMAQNLKSVHYSDGTTEITGKYYPNNNSGNVATYGYLYNWSAVMHGSTTEGAQGICPTGWHVPTVAEYQSIISSQDISLYFGNQPAGYYSIWGYLGFSTYAQFWTSGVFQNVYKTFEVSSASGPSIYEYEKEDTPAFSVRCVRDE